jgi:hypothetical protein
MKVFSGAIQHAKFEHRSPDKIERYRSYSSIVIEATYPRIRGKRGKLTKCFFAVGYGSFFSKILRLYWKILTIKWSLKVEIMLLRKYNMIFNVKDAAVNRKS